MNTQLKPEPLLWLDDHRGVYIPRDFAKSFADRDKSVTGVSAEDWETLEAGPDHEGYWDVWTEVCNDAVVTDKGIKYSVYQDGACWLVPEGMVMHENGGFFEWPEEEEKDEE